MGSYLYSEYETVDVHYCGNWYCVKMKKNCLCGDIVQQIWRDFILQTDLQKQFGISSLIQINDIKEPIHYGLTVDYKLVGKDQRKTLRLARPPLGDDIKNANDAEASKIK